MFLDKIQLEEHESVLTQTRRHWFVLYAQLAGPVLAAFVPALVLAIILFSDSVSPYLSAIVPYMFYILFFYAAWLFLMWMAIFNIWTNYYLDVITVTNQRLILVNQKGLFHRTIASFRLERLQDLNVDIDGILATFLDYGTLHAETAGHAEEEFRAWGMPHPRELKALVVEAADKLMGPRAGYAGPPSDDVGEVPAQTPPPPEATPQ